MKWEKLGDVFYFFKECVIWAKCFFRVDYLGMGGEGFPGGSDSKETACNVGDQGSSLGWEDPLEEGLATHYSILAWRIPMDTGAWRATVHGVAKNWTWLKD